MMQDEDGLAAVLYRAFMPTNRSAHLAYDVFKKAHDKFRAEYDAADFDGRYGVLMRAIRYRDQLIREAKQS